MTRSTLVPIAERLASSLPSFAARGRMVLRAPITDILLAVHLEPSAFEQTTLRAVAYAMPLCVPFDCVHFHFAHWLKNGGRIYAVWQRSQPDLVASLHDSIVREAYPFFEQHKSLTDFVATHGESDDLHELRYLAYCSARIGDRVKALDYIEKLQAISIDRSIAWQDQLRREVDAFQALLASSPDDAMRQLEAWEHFTIQSLKLTPFRSPSI